jgi:hypothetical protein
MFRIVRSMDTFADIIALWGTATSLGQDIGESGVTVRAWRNRNSIPSRKWPVLVRAARRRGLNEVTFEALAKISERAALNANP